MVVVDELEGVLDMVGFGDVFLYFVEFVGIDCYKIVFLVVDEFCL